MPGGSLEAEREMRKLKEGWNDNSTQVYGGQETHMLLYDYEEENTVLSISWNRLS